MSIKPFFWSLANGIGTRFVSLIFFVAISRLITATDLGVMALGLMVALVLDTIIEQGLISAVIQKKEISDGHTGSAFIYQSTLGIVLGIFVWLASPIIAMFLKEPKVAAILPWIGLASFFNSVGYVKQGLLQRAMLFKILAIRNMAATLVGCALGLLYAKNGAGVDSLVIMHVTNSGLGALVLWTTPYSNIRFKFNSSKLRELLLFSRSIFGTRILEVISSRLDQILISQIYGTTILGYYSLAIRLYEILIQAVSSPIAAVAYPVLSREQNDKNKLGLSYLRLVEFGGGLTVPLFIGAAATAPFFVPAFFGEQWGPAVNYIIIIFTIGMVSSMDTYNDVLFSSIGRPDLRLKYSISGLLVWLLAALVLLPYGNIFSAIVLALRGFIMFVPRTVMALAMVKLKFNIFLKIAFPIWIASFCMVLIILAISSMKLTNVYFLLSLQIVVGGVMYMYLLNMLGSALPKYLLRIKVQSNLLKKL